MLKATEIQGRRYYKTPNGNVYPSVTTVVGYPKEQFFKEWRARVSKHERTYGASRGTSLHNIVESHLAGEVIDVKNPIHKELFEKLLPYLDKVSEIECQETTFWSDVLKMAGRLDLCAKYNGVRSIIDFKTGKEPKPKAWLEEYFLQVTAYIHMWNEHFPLPEDQVTQGVILYTPETGAAEEHIFSPNEYLDALSNRIMEFYRGVHTELFKKVVEDNEYEKSGQEK